MTEQKDILEKLNEIALEANWGTTERINGVPKAVAVIQEAMEEIKRLRMRIINWRNDIDADEKVRKETAKEVLQDLNDRSVWFIVGTAQFVQDHFWEQFDEMCQSYGVEIDKNE